MSDNMSRGLFGALSLGLAVALAGCANLTDIKANLQKKPPCCKSFDELTYSAIPAKDTYPIQLGDHSPVFEFDVGKSYFTALELPPASAGRQFQMYSMATGSTAFEVATLAQIFCPRVLFLDASKAVIRAEEQLPRYDVFKGFGALRRGAGSEARVPEGARYAVVHSNPARYGEFVYRHDGPSGYMVGATYVREAGGALPFPCAPVADALVRLQ